MKPGIKKQNTAADNTGNKSSITPREIEKEKDICSEFNHNRTQKFSRLELEITGEEMGLEKRVFKKNNLIRPGNRKTRMLFCQEKRNWTKEDWKKLFSSDETMVVIKNACKIQIWGKSDKKHVPHLICFEDKKQVAVMLWRCVSSRGEEALIPVLGTIDSVKYIYIF